VPPGLIVVLAVTGLLISVLAMLQFASILGPVPLALILAMSVHPLTGILRRRGAPMWLAVTVTLVTLTGHPAQGCPAPRAGNQPTVSP
jgi:AI-2 transport protein TqsA